MVFTLLPLLARLRWRPATATVKLGKTAAGGRIADGGVHHLYRQQELLFVVAARLAGVEAHRRTAQRPRRVILVADIDGELRHRLSFPPLRSSPASLWRSRASSATLLKGAIT